jgi:hypothetical protein
MTTEYYRVEENINGGKFWALRRDQLTLEEARDRVKMRRQVADGNWQYRIVKVTETREVVNESEATNGQV